MCQTIENKHGTINAELTCCASSNTRPIGYTESNGAKGSNR